MPKQTFFNLPDEKKERILDCAVEEFAEHGYVLASISRIVAAAGIAKGSFYQYFEDKDDLYIYIVKTMIADRKLGVYEENKESLKTLKLMDFLRLVFHLQVEEFSRNPRLLQIGLDVARNINTPIWERIWNEYPDILDSYYLPYISHEMEQGEIMPQVNMHMLNYMLLSLGNYMLYLIKSGGNGSLAIDAIDSLVDDAEYILTQGIYPKEGG